MNYEYLIEKVLELVDYIIYAAVIYFIGASIYAEITFQQSLVVSVILMYPHFIVKNHLKNKKE